MRIKKGRYVKSYWSEISSAINPQLTDHEKLVNKIYTSGAMYVYQLLWKEIVRKDINDTTKLQLKNEYYDNNKLACCVSIRRLHKSANFGVNKVQKALNLLKEANWLEAITNDKTKQIVYVLGEWEITEKNKYVEKLYKDTRKCVIKKESTELQTNKKINDNFMLRMKLMQKRKRPNEGKICETAR